MKNLCILKMTISIFRRIIVGICYVDHESQSQLKYNEKLVCLKMAISVFRQIIIGLYYVGRGTQSQLKCNKKPKPTKM